MEKWFVRTFAFSFKLWLSAVVSSDSRNCVWRPLREPCRQCGTYELPLRSANSSPHLPSLVVLDTLILTLFPSLWGRLQGVFRKASRVSLHRLQLCISWLGGGCMICFIETREGENHSQDVTSACATKRKSTLFLGGVLMMLLCEAQHWYSIAIMLHSENE